MEQQVDICIASVGRSQLADLLGAIAKLDVPVHTTIRVVIADDGPPGAVAKVVARSHGLDVVVVRGGGRNIAATRNATLEAARGDWLAFVDDDTRPNPDWLLMFLTAIRSSNADGAIGRVIPDLELEAFCAAAYKNAFHHWPGLSGARLRTGWTSCAIVSGARVRALGLRFDERLGRTGGEDTDFFARLSASGGRLIACPEAVVREAIPSERMTPSYVRARAIRHGYDYARSTKRTHRARERIAVYGRSLAKVMAFGSAALLARPFLPAHSLSYRVRYWLAWGELRHLFALPPPGPYAWARKEIVSEQD